MKFNILDIKGHFALLQNNLFYILSRHPIMPFGVFQDINSLLTTVGYFP